MTRVTRGVDGLAMRSSAAGPDGVGLHHAFFKLDLMDARGLHTSSKSLQASPFVLWLWPRTVTPLRAVEPISTSQTEGKTKPDDMRYLDLVAIFRVCGGMCPLDKSSSAPHCTGAAYGWPLTALHAAFCFSWHAMAVFDWVTTSHAAWSDPAGSLALGESR